MGKKTTEQTITQESKPDPFLRDIQRQFLSNIPQFPSGTLVAPLAPKSLAANKMLTEFATSPQAFAAQPLAADSARLAGISSELATSPFLTDSVLNQARTLNTIADVSNLDPRSNPFVAAAADAANRQTVGTLVNDVLPRIRDSEVTAGQFGGSRRGIAEANAVSGAAQAIADTTSRAFFGQYNQNVQNALQAARQAPATLMLPQQALGMAQGAQTSAINDRNAANMQALRAIDVLDKAGQQLQGQAQQVINGEVQRFMANVQIPLETVRAVGGLTAANSSAGTITSAGLGRGVSPLAGAAGGALAGVSLGSAIGPSLVQAGMFASMSAAMPWFAIGGAALGLLM